MSSHTAPLGSYAFTTFTNTNRELERLESQASIAWELESKLLSSHGLTQADAILDLACGPGAITRRIAERVPHAQVTGLDYERRLLDVAEEASSSMPHPPRFEEGDVYSLSTTIGNFDFVYARFLFQHLERPADALKEIQARLNKGGRLLIVDVDDRDLHCTPANQRYTDFVTMVADAQRSGGGNRMIGRELPTLLAANGYKNIRVDQVKLDSRTFGLDKFFEITTAFKLEQLSADERTRQTHILESLREEMKQTHTHIEVTVHCVSGESQ